MNSLMNAAPDDLPEVTVIGLGLTIGLTRGHYKHELAVPCRRTPSLLCPLEGEVLMFSSCADADEYFLVQIMV